MARLSTPFDWWAQGVQTALMLAEANAVIAMRLWGMSGVWSVTGHEDTRMVSEKLEAARQSTLAATRATLSGKRPDQITAAALKPIRQKTRANARRLAKRGPKRG